MSEHKKVSMLGVNVTGMPVEDAVEETLRLMTEPRLGKIYFLTAESSLLCQSDERAVEFLNSCDLVMPGDSHTGKAFDGLPDIRDRDSDSQATGKDQEIPGDFAQQYMRTILPRMNGEELSIYAIMDSETGLLSLQEYILTNYPSINLEGILIGKDSEEEYGRVVNDVNKCVPDIVFVCVSAEQQIRFVRGFASMMNTGLCICIESMQPWIYREVTEVPGFFRMLHLESLYYWIRKENKLGNLIAGSAFRKRMRDE